MPPFHLCYTLQNSKRNFKGYCRECHLEGQWLTSPMSVKTHKKYNINTSLNIDNPIMVTYGKLSEGEPYIHKMDLCWQFAAWFPVVGFDW